MQEPPGNQLALQRTLSESSSSDPDQFRADEPTWRQVQGRSGGTFSGVCLQGILHLNI